MLLFQYYNGGKRNGHRKLKPPSERGTEQKQLTYFRQKTNLGS